LPRGTTLIRSSAVHTFRENMGDATQLITAVEEGDPKAAEKLLALVSL
jgi:hypothetical protein